MANFPDKFQVATQQSKERSFFPLEHHHLTTTDFFKMQPVVARKVEPNDTMDIDVTSFVRLFPMPFPVFGRIRYYNRCFFVPYRQIMEGFNEFITDTQYRSSGGFVKIKSAPYFTNKDVADAFYSSYVDSDPKKLCEPIDTTVFYWRSLDGIDYMCTYQGEVASFSGQSPYGVACCFIRDDQGFRFCRAGDSFYNKGVDAFDFDTVGTYTQTPDYTPPTGYSSITLSYGDDTAQFDYSLSLIPRYYGTFVIDDGLTDPTPSMNFDDVRFDFKFGTTPFRFTNVGRNFYTILCSLGYRVDFTNSAGVFTNGRSRNAGKLLAYLKVFLDWYAPSAYSETNALRMMFVGTSSSGRHILYSELLEIAKGLDFVCYERDYFTSAWQNPTGPNVDPSSVTISDISVDNTSSLRSRLINSETLSNYGSSNNTPSIVSEFGGDLHQPSPTNLSYYMLEQLRALTTDQRRAQLAGNKVVDRYLAQYGIKLDDDRTNRCYYIGGYHYDADIMDIMSTADTAQAALGDYAGKGIAYSDAHRSFHFESGQESGIIIVVSSVVPTVGYVQGVDRENLQLSRLQFFNGDFDNLGTQPQVREELFGDAGMPSPDGTLVTSITVDPQSVRGFVPRYIEEKIGRDFLTGDFNIPSRRQGMDAFHLFRLFNTPNISSINKGFLIGEQKQYDRIFNNTDDNYDHMYVTHNVYIKAWRNMKSVQDVYDFEHSDGKSIDVEANGTQLS